MAKLVQPVRATNKAPIREAHTSPDLIQPVVLVVLAVRHFHGAREKGGDLIYIPEKRIMGEKIRFQFALPDGWLLPFIWSVRRGEGLVQMCCDRRSSCCPGRAPHHHHHQLLHLNGKGTMNAEGEEEEDDDYYYYVNNDEANSCSASEIQNGRNATRPGLSLSLLLSWPPSR